MGTSLRFFTHPALFLNSHDIPAKCRTGKAQRTQGCEAAL